MIPLALNMRVTILGLHLATLGLCQQMTILGPLAIPMLTAHGM